MAFSIQTMLDQNLFDGLRPAAGLDGLSNEVTWINVMEILDTPESVKAGELLLTTGYQLDRQELHLDLIPILHSHGVAGMIVQSGYYIDHIPDWLIETADQYNFPILEIPSEYTFSEVLHRTISAITQAKDDYSKAPLDFDYFLPLLKAESASLFSSMASEQYSTPLIFAASLKGDPASRTLSEIHERIGICLSGNGTFSHFRLPGNRQGVWFVLPLATANYHSIVYDLQLLIESLSRTHNCTIHMGSAKCTYPENLNDAFLAAAKSIQLLDDIHALHGICPSNQYAVVKMLGKINRLKDAETFIHPAVLLLSRKDEGGHYDYIRTLKIYLAENCNMTHTAARLFVHRHTLINRIAAITEICGIDLDDYYTRFHLTLSLLMQDYYGSFF